MAGVKDLAPEVRGCFLKGVDPDELTLLKWADYNLDNCMLDCKLRTAASICNCVPWYFVFKHPGIEFQACELSGHLCFMNEMLSLTAWGAEDDLEQSSGNIDAIIDGMIDEEEELAAKRARNPCNCRPACDRFSYYSRLAKTSAQKLRHEKYRWMTAVPRQSVRLYTRNSFYDVREDKLVI